MDIADPYVSRVLRGASDLMMLVTLENDSGDQHRGQAEACKRCSKAARQQRRVGKAV